MKYLPFLARCCKHLRPILSLVVAAATWVPALPAADIGLPIVGKVQPRAAHEIAGSSWSIGGETIDRDFAVYQNYRKYLGPLGAKAIRLQAGWAKCEREPGIYTWAWLDEIVTDAIAQGVQPWLELGYGNRVYPGGGGPGLGDGLPSSPEALAAWDRWAKALVERYKDRVQVWEIWNEPDLASAVRVTVDGYVGLYHRTASIIRSQQTESRIIALALLGNIDFADQFLAGMQAKGRLDLIDTITIHGYPRNPDDTTNIDRLQAVIAKYGRAIEVRQGETGAPSRHQRQFALKEISWTENLQAKWNLRRMLVHRGRDVPFNLFTMIDLHYTHYHLQSGNALRMNFKGLLATNPDQTVAHAKPSYYAAQNVFSIFDHTLNRILDYPFTSTSLRGVALTGYQYSAKGGQVVAYWINDAPPADSNGVTFINLTLARGRFTEPVLVDLLTGMVYALAPASWEQRPDGVTFVDLPVYDAPMLIAEKAVLHLEAARGQSSAANQSQTNIVK